MIDARRLVRELKERKEKHKTALNEYNELTKVANTAASGVDHGFKAGVSVATIAHSLIPTNVSVAGLVIQLIVAVPAIIETLNSDKPVLEKLAALTPLLVLFALTAIATILTLITLALAGAIVGLTLAGLFVGLTGYNLFKAYLAREAIGTNFENQVDSIKGIYDFLKSSDEERAVTVIDDPAVRAELLATLQARLADLQVYESAGQSSDKILGELQIALEALAAYDQKIHEATPEAIILRKTIANEDQILSSKVGMAFAITGVILATMGVMALTIGAAPVLGTVIAVFSLILMTVSLVKLATDLSLKRAENQKIEAAGDKQIVELIDEALLNTAPEIQAEIVPVTHPAPIPEPAKKTPENLPNWKKDPAPSSGPGHNGETLFSQKNRITTIADEEKKQDFKRRTL